MEDNKKIKSMGPYPKLEDVVKPKVNRYSSHYPRIEEKNNIIMESIKCIEELRNALIARINEVSSLKTELKRAQEHIEFLENKMEKEIQNTTTDILLNETFESHIVEMKEAVYDSLGKKIIDEFNKRAETIKALKEENKYLHESNNSLKEKFAELEERVKEAESLSKYLDDITKLYDKEKDDAISSIEDLKSQIRNLTSSIEAKNREISHLRSKMRNTNIPIIYFGDEKDFYQDEQHDIIIEALEERLKSVYPGSRSEDVLKSILKANPKNGFRDDLKERISNFFKAFNGWSRATKTQKNIFLNIGFKIISSVNHPKFAFYGDTRYSIMLSSTPSDYKSIKNHESEIKKKIL